MLRWNSTLTTGVTKIDTQHQELFDRMNMLLIAMRKGRRNEDILILIDYLESYISKIFNDEEYLQKKFDSRWLEQQFSGHAKIKEVLKNLRETVETIGLSAIFITITEYKIIYWYKEHIGYTDGNFREFLNKKSA